jgi:deoxyhypusine synthase
MSQALGAWERMARDPRCALVLALGAPVVAAGLREVLVYLADRRLVDVVIAGSADLFADLHEALGHVHYVDGGVPVASAADRARTVAFLAEFATGLARERQGQPVGARAFLRALGEALPARAPRKGLIQAAATANIPLYCPDLGAGPIGAALLAARAGGVMLQLDPLDDLAGLTAAYGAAPRAGLICVGQGPAAALALEAHTLSASQSDGDANDDANGAAPFGVITLGAPALGAPSSQALAAVETDVLLALPLVVSGLAQRMPGTRSRRGRVGTQAASLAPEQALA